MPPPPQKPEAALSRRRAATLLLVVGGVTLALTAAEDVPSRRSVTLRVARPGGVRKVALELVDADGDLVHALERHYGSTGAPAAIDCSVKASSGPHEVHLAVTRADGKVQTEVRRVPFGDGEGEHAFGGVCEAG